MIDIKLPLFLTLILTFAASINIQFQHEAKHMGSNYAVLIAGSNSYYNYRHQADIAHAYHILTKLGSYPPSNIITMMYDDVAWSDSNPFPGQLFNEPDGDDVYDNIHIDYKGDDVTADNFISVLKGIPIPNRKELPVLNNTLSTDNIFIYYSDHGAPGLVAMPSGPPLYAIDLHETFHYMKENKMYNELVFYLEACESGSMFDNLLEDTLSIFATTASNPYESSYAYYYNSTLSTYMADEYSIRWMQDTTYNWDKGEESLIKQFKDVANMVQLSSPQKYGDESFEDVAIRDFEAFEYHEPVICKQSQYVPYRFDSNWIPNKMFVDSRNVKLAVLQHRFLESKSDHEREYWKKMIEIELRERNKIDVLFNNIIDCLIGEDKNDYIVSDMNIMQWDCLKTVYQEFENKCDTFTDFSLKYVQYLVNLCHVVDTEEIIDAFDELC